MLCTCVLPWLSLSCHLRLFCDSFMTPLRQAATILAYVDGSLDRRGLTTRIHSHVAYRRLRWKTHHAYALFHHRSDMESSMDSARKVSSIKTSSLTNAALK